MASTITHETHPVDGRVVLVSTPAGETSPAIWMPNAGGVGYMASSGVGTAAIEGTRSLPSLVKANTAVWESIVAATATEGAQTIPAYFTAIRLLAVTDTATFSMRYAPVL